MQLIPSIDLRRGKVVRLAQGRDDQVTIYSEDPVAVLCQFQDAGAERVHVVDLDAAFGEPRQEELLTRLVRSAQREKLQLGGGLRSLDSIQSALDSGFHRAVIGSMVVREPALFGRCASAHPGRLIPALEFRNGELRAGGWSEGTTLGLEEALKLLLPFTGLFSEALVTDIARDGMLRGPNCALALEVARGLGIRAIVSGGVTELSDVTAASAHSEFSGLIVGRALLEGRIDLRAAIDALRVVRTGVPA